MSVRVFDFLCGHGHVSEMFVDTGTESVPCTLCGGIATRQPAAPRAKLEPFTGAFPGAADKWVRDRESKMAQEKRNVENHGTYK